jgi:hypothetical protein
MINRTDRPSLSSTREANIVASVDRSISDILSGQREIIHSIINLVDTIEGRLFGCSPQPCSPESGKTPIEPPIEEQTAMILDSLQRVNNQLNAFVGRI